MLLCDKCAKPFEISDGYLLRHGILGSYRVCDDCSLALEQFIERVDRAKERRANKRQAATADVRDETR